MTIALRSAEPTSATEPQLPLETSGAPGHGFPKVVRYTLVALLVGLVLTDRVAVSVGTLPLGASLPLTYILLGVLLLNRKLVLDPAAVIIYALACSIAVVSALLNLNMGHGIPVSLASMALLIVIYLPFVFTISPEAGSQAQWRWAMGLLSNVLLVLCTAGIVQFYAQFLIKAPWLFNASILLPDAIRGGGIYNSAIPIGSFFKSNGFFSREPSGFSYLMAFGLLLEWALFKRRKRMLAFGLGLALSYSGTGLLMLAVGMLLPLRIKTLLTIGVGGLVIFVCNLAAGDPLNLALTFARIGEFTAPGSSAHARYVAPMLMISDNIETDFWSMWFGHGAGTVNPTAARAFYETHDPTWAKLLLEYGFLGFFAFVGLILYKLSGFAAPFQLRAVLFASWLVGGGHLLSPENTYFLFAVVALWPRTPGAEQTQRAAARAASSSMPQNPTQPA